MSDMCDHIMSDIPKVKIMGLDYDIEFVEQIDKHTRLSGQIDYAGQVIKIEKGMKKGLTGRTLLHEILHGVLDGLGYSDIRDNEQLIDGLSAALHQVIKDNFEIISSWCL